MKKISKIETDLKLRNLKLKFAKLLLRLGIISGIALSAGCSDKYVEPTTIEAEIVTSDEDIVEQTKDEEVSTEEVVEEDIVIDAKYIINHVENMSEKYPHIAKDMLLSIIFSANYDNLTEEDRNIVLEAYSTDIKELNRRLYDYMDIFKNVSNVTAKAVEEGTLDELPKEYNYENWIKVNEFILDKNYKELADRYEEGFKNRIYDASSDKTKTIELDYKHLNNSPERTLYILDRNTLYGKYAMLTVYEREFLKGDNANMVDVSNEDTNNNNLGKK